LGSSAEGQLVVAQERSDVVLGVDLLLGQLVYQLSMLDAGTGS
jgi:hypothetical protein